MGAAKRRRQKFLADHPRCCFCAGDRPAEEQDHQPARAFFQDRQWPEGFVFPACTICNRVSKDAENALSLIAFSPKNPEERLLYQRRVAAVRQGNPALLDRLGMSAMQKRRVLEKSGLEKPEGFVFAQLPLIKLPTKEWEPLFTIVGQKLMLALHYQCFGRPLPRRGGLYLYTRTNVDHIDITNAEALKLTPNVVMPRRGRKQIGRQFSVRWNASNDPVLGAFIVHIQGIIVFQGHTAEDPDVLEKLGSRHCLRPLQ